MLSTNRGDNGDPISQATPLTMPPLAILPGSIGSLHSFAGARLRSWSLLRRERVTVADGALITGIVGGDGRVVLADGLAVPLRFCRQGTVSQSAGRDTMFFVAPRQWDAVDNYILSSDPLELVLKYEAIGAFRAELGDSGCSSFGTPWLRELVILQPYGAAHQELRAMLLGHSPLLPGWVLVAYGQHGGRQ